MKRNGDATPKIIFMWSILFVGTGAIAFLTVLAFPEKKEGIPEPEYQRFAATASEGVAGGAMMACIATAMLPEVSTNTPIPYRYWEHIDDQHYTKLVLTSKPRP